MYSNLVGWENNWLSNLNGWAEQQDDDWYRIHPDQPMLYVQVWFTHADGDIDFELYDSGGGLVNGAPTV